MSIAGNDYDASINELRIRSTSLKSTTVQPPRVSEALASFECMISTLALGEKGGLEI